MIHLYQNNGYNIVLDVNSGSVHVVDKAAYDVIGALERQNEFHTPDTDVYKRQLPIWNGSAIMPLTWRSMRRI